MTQGSLQQVADCDDGQTVPFPSGFKATDVIFLNLYFRAVLDQDDALIVRNEVC